MFSNNEPPLERLYDEGHRVLEAIDNRGSWLPNCMYSMTSSVYKFLFTGDEYRIMACRFSGIR